MLLILQKVSRAKPARCSNKLVGIVPLETDLFENLLSLLAQRLGSPSVVVVSFKSVVFVEIGGFIKYRLGQPKASLSSSSL